MKLTSWLLSDYNVNITVNFISTAIEKSGGKIRYSTQTMTYFPNKTKETGQDLKMGREKSKSHHGT